VTADVLILLKLSELRSATVKRPNVLPANADSSMTEAVNNRSAATSNLVSENLTSISASGDSSCERSLNQPICFDRCSMGEDGAALFGQPLPAARLSQATSLYPDRVRHSRRDRAASEDVMHMERTGDRLFGDSYQWSVLGGGRSQIPPAASMGAHVRVGLEDALWLGKGKLAESNAQQVLARSHCGQRNGEFQPR
jgi:beta-keto acid cleavage enzyme